MGIIPFLYRSRCVLPVASWKSEAQPPLMDSCPRGSGAILHVLSLSCVTAWALLWPDHLATRLFSASSLPDCSGGTGAWACIPVPTGGVRLPGVMLHMCTQPSGVLAQAALHPHAMHMNSWQKRSLLCGWLPTLSSEPCSALERAVVTRGRRHAPNTACGARWSGHHRTAQGLGY